MDGFRLGRMLQGTVLAAAGMILLTACDYWPPALQAQIEQLRTEAKQAAAERAGLEEQLNHALKLQGDLHARVEDLTRTNQELSGRVAALDQALAAERQKVAHLQESARKTTPAVSGKTKTPAKQMPKVAAKKKAPKAKAAKAKVADSGKPH
jgi:septal ring factor EnvC (AmiA/AmiB activator)